MSFFAIHRFFGIPLSFSSSVSSFQPPLSYLPLVLSCVHVDTIEDVPSLRILQLFIFVGPPPCYYHLLHCLPNLYYAAVAYGIRTLGLLLKFSIRIPQKSLLVLEEVSSLKMLLCYVRKPCSIASIVGDPSDTPMRKIRYRFLTWE